MNVKKLLCLVIGHMWENADSQTLPRRKCVSCGVEQMKLSCDTWVKANKRIRKL